jgi:pyrroline-5-carboxylate reductase
LKISFSGNPSTLERIKKENLEECITTNNSICNNSDIIFLTLKPFDTGILSTLNFPDHSSIVSCIAGYNIAKLSMMTKRNVTRMMTSSPMTIGSGKGICAIYNEDSLIESLLLKIGLKIFNLSEEYLFNIFTAAVCLPGAFLQLEIDGKTYSDSELENMYNVEFKLIGSLIKWAHSVTPQNLSPDEQKNYIIKMSTKGGIAEAIINALKDGLTLVEAFKVGISRSNEIVSGS